LRACLDSIDQTVDALSYEIIVVDNASTDGSLDMLSQKYSRVKTIANSENRGFGAANNQGFAVMQGEYALLINTDAVLTKGAVQKLWDFAEANPRAAIVCGQLLNADGSKQNSVAAFPTLLTLASNTSLLEYFFPGKYPSKRYDHQRPLEVDSAIGACMMIRKKALDEVSFFDERYFFFFEETDLAFAMKRVGWKVYQVPDALIYHCRDRASATTRNRASNFTGRATSFAQMAWRRLLPGGVSRDFSALADQHPACRRGCCVYAGHGKRPPAETGCLYPNPPLGNEQ